jgi:hypothetical protein
MRRPVNLRSVLLGLAGVCFICILTPYNDYAVNNTLLVGSYLPLGLLMFLLTIVLLVNSPLRKWRPQWALSAGELTVAVAMTLAACGVAGAGLMRFLPTTLVALYNKAAPSRDYRELLTQADLPDWMFPTLKGETIPERASEPVIQNFVQRIPHDADESAVWREVLSAWVTPALAWAIFVAAMFTGVICLMVIVRRQWVENERLPFPLAGVYHSLIEAPEPGRTFNALFRSVGFWIACLFVLVLHSINVMSVYDPQHFPNVPLGYQFQLLFSEPPWVYLEWHAKQAVVSFCVIGITYFLQTKIAFSLWFFYILSQALRMTSMQYQVEITPGERADQAVGAAVVFVGMILWIGRHHWALVIRQMFRPPREGEPQGRYLPYALAGWGFVASILTMSIWLTVAGAKFWAALAIVLLMFCSFLIIARVVSETGLIFVQMSAIDSRFWIYLAELGLRVPPSTALLSKLVPMTSASDLRESLGGYTSQSLKLADETSYGHERNWRRVIPFTLCLLLAVTVAYVVAGISSLYVEYSYAATLDRAQTEPINEYAMERAIITNVLAPASDYVKGRSPVEPHNRAAHFSAGAGLTALLAALRLRFASWPLHPVGFLLVYTYPLTRIWLSVMIGWIAKVLIVNYGGAQLFRAARPVFIGMIIGEVGAAAVWLVVSLVRVAMGLDYSRVNVLPI